MSTGGGGGGGGGHSIIQYLMSILQFVLSLIISSASFAVVVHLLFWNNEGN